jgi:hypothetical protein
MTKTKDKSRLTARSPRTQSRFYETTGRLFAGGEVLPFSPRSLLKNLDRPVVVGVAVMDPIAGIDDELVTCDKLLWSTEAGTGRD